MSTNINNMYKPFHVILKQWKNTSESVKNVIKCYTGLYGPIWVARGEQSNVEKGEINYQASRFFRGLCQVCEGGAGRLCMAGPVMDVVCAWDPGSRQLAACGRPPAPEISSNDTCACVATLAKRHTARVRTRLSVFGAVVERLALP